MSRRAVFTKTYWREFRRDLKRSKKDKRARLGVMMRLAALFYFVGILWYYGGGVYRLHDSATYFTLGCGALVLAVIVAGRKISHWLDERQQIAEDLAATPDGVAERLQRLALGQLAMTERALSEVWLLKHEVPAGFEPRSRKIQIDKLRDAFLWEEIPTEVRAWMMRPDGEWPPERSAHVLLGAETLHSLLWALFLLPELRRLDQLAAPLKFAPIAKALRGKARGVRPTWDLRVARNQANELFVRCYAERVHRGLQDPDNEQQKAAIEDWMEGIAGGDVADAFAGDETIAELDEATLGQVGRSAARRLVILDLILNVMDGVECWPKLTTLVYGPLLPYEADEDEVVASS
jgi:hypothetical protein